MKKIILLAIALIGFNAGAQSLPKEVKKVVPAAATKQAEATGKAEVKSAKKSNSTLKKVNKTSKDVEKGADEAAKYSNNKAISTTKKGAKSVKDATAQ
ncbi:hypothetical protein [Flavobacterium sp.]|jgi:hypothetical protein|uniref:hypothetical protein n=1 Tax=Flavobacterium sp. TaxID=239 RepID=UPI0037C17914